MLSKKEKYCTKKNNSRKKSYFQNNMGFLTFYNSYLKTIEVNWMNTILLTIMKVSKLKLGPLNMPKACPNSLKDWYMY